MTGVRVAVSTAIALATGACAYGYAEFGRTFAPSDFATRPAIVQPADNFSTPEKVALGRMLFTDQRLSVDGARSCASCHQAAREFADGLPLGQGTDGRMLLRHTPTLWNVGFATHLFWDGRAASLEDQALRPVMNGNELARHPAAAVDPIRADPTYRARFASAFPADPVASELNVARALAVYQRTLVSGSAPFDRWISGDARAISPAAQRGFSLFAGKANCAACHSGGNLTDQRFHDVGLPDADLGRGALMSRRGLDHAFRTPSLREIGRTAPYMHDGSLASLEAVVDHYSDKVVPRRSAPPRSRLSASERADLVEFLQTLDSEASR